MFNTIISVMDTVPQYQESIESILLWSFSSIFTNIKSIFSYIFMFFNKSRDNDNQSEDNKNTVIQDLQQENTTLRTQVTQLLAANNGISKALTSHIESLTIIKQEFNESEERNKELIALARFETYLKSSRNAFIVAIYVALSADYACFSVTALISKLEKLKDMSVNYEIESKSKLVEKYQYEIKSQKEYMRDQEEPYFIDTLENSYKEARDELTTRFAKLRKNQVTFLEQYKQMKLANDDLKACIRQVPITERLGFYSSTMEGVQKLSHLEDNVKRLNNNIKKLDKDLSNELSTLDRHVKDVLTLERLILEYNIAIHKYVIYLKLDDPTINKSLVTTKLESENSHKLGCQELVDNAKQNITQIQSNLSSAVNKEDNLLKQCENMCLTGKKDIANWKLRLTKGESMTQKGDTKELIINKNKSTLLNVSEGIQSTGEASGSIGIARMITDETPNG
jgi:hypothetical protein